MDYPTATTTPPGWYADPSVAGQQRWFDGTQWSHHVRPAPPQEPVVVPYGGERRRGRRGATGLTLVLVIVTVVGKLTLLGVRLAEEHAENVAQQASSAEPAHSRAQPQEFPFHRAELEQEISSRLLAEQGLTVVATCPDPATVMPGMEFLCWVDDGGGPAAGGAHIAITDGGGWTWNYAAGCQDLGAC